MTKEDRIILACMRAFLLIPATWITSRYIFASDPTIAATTKVKNTILAARAFESYVWGNDDTTAD